MKTEELNEQYSIVYIKWKPNNGIKFIPQPGMFHTIQEALIEIAKLSQFNTTGQYHIITPYCKYEVIDTFKMKIKKIETF